MNDYRPVMTDGEEYQEELEYAIDDCITYLILAIQSLKGYREFSNLKDDIQTALQFAKEEKEEIKDYGK